MWTSRLLSPILERKATFFEATTALAFADFAARGAEIAVVEVGLGGRLDSTNVVQPLASGVTKIERDHMKYLGDTLELIASEKAGIAKPGVPFVIGETDPTLVEVLRREARRAVGRADGQARADIRVLPRDYEWRGPLSLAGPGILTALPSPYRPTATQIERAFGLARIAGRLDQRGRWLFDVAHNPDGMRSLVKALAATGPARPLHALVSILGDKEWPEMLVQLDQVIDRGILTIAPTAAGRGWDIEWLRRWLKDPNRPPAHAEWTLIPDFQEAIATVQGGAGTVLVTGSFHTVGDVMSVLGMDI
jgi:dihydrofolate synthase/folylpolyglutamate synthase